MCCCSAVLSNLSLCHSCKLDPDICNSLPFSLSFFTLSHSHTSLFHFFSFDCFFFFFLLQTNLAVDTPLPSGDPSHWPPADTWRVVSINRFQWRIPPQSHIPMCQDHFCHLETKQSRGILLFLCPKLWQRRLGPGRVFERETETSVMGQRRSK